MEKFGGRGRGKNNDADKILLKLTKCIVFSFIGGSSKIIKLSPKFKLKFCMIIFCRVHICNYIEKF